MADPQNHNLIRNNPITNDVWIGRYNFTHGGVSYLAPAMRKDFKPVADVDNFIGNPSRRIGVELRQVAPDSVKICERRVSPNNFSQTR